ncbi:MAG: transglutaminase domain-containing protein [Prevotella sp.]|jgi:hypothetical protein
MAKKYLYNYQTIVTLGAPVSTHSVMLRCRPCENNFQTVDEHYLVCSPIFRLRKGVDAFGNSILYGGTREEHSLLAYVSTGIVSCGAYRLHEDHVEPYYRLPSALTIPTDEMMALEVPKEGSVEDRAGWICHQVHSMLHYQTGVTDITTTASDVFALRQGVCQDYAHLMISLCRANGIVARYVNGLMEGIGATHAWVEVYDGEDWIAFDPTHDRKAEYGYLKIAHGRDASDCPVSRGTFLGCASQETYVSVTVKEI